MDNLNQSLVLSEVKLFLDKYGLLKNNIIRIENSFKQEKNKITFPYTSIGNDTEKKIMESLQEYYSM